MPRKSFEGVIYVRFEDEPIGRSIGLKWFSDRSRATFQVGMNLVATSYLRHTKRGRGVVEISVIDNDGRKIVATTEMRVVQGIFNNAWKGRRMIIHGVE